MEDRTVRSWQEAANTADPERSMQLSCPDVELAGPRGSVRDREVLKDWLLRAGLTLETSRTFAREGAGWRSGETREFSGEAAIAPGSLADDRRVARLARYDGADALDAALADAGPGDGR